MGITWDHVVWDICESTHDFFKGYLFLEKFLPLLRHIQTLKRPLHDCHTRQMWQKCYTPLYFREKYFHQLNWYHYVNTSAVAFNILVEMVTWFHIVQYPIYFFILTSSTEKWLRISSSFNILFIATSLHLYNVKIIMELPPH